MSILEEKVTQDMTDIDGNKSDGEGIDNTQDSQDTEFIINIKDYGYEISDPRHFGIYDDDSEEEVEEVDGVEDEEDEYYYDEEEEVDGSYGNIQHSGMFTTKHDENELGRYTDNMEQLSHSTSNVVTDDTYFAQGDGNNEILHAVALYPFVPENSNELSLVPDQLLIINYECGDGWLVAHDPETGETGLVPTEYIKMLEGEPSFDQLDNATYNEFAEDAKDAHRFMPELLGNDDDEIPTDKLNNLNI